MKIKYLILILLLSITTSYAKQDLKKFKNSELNITADDVVLIRNDDYSQSFLLSDLLDENDVDNTKGTKYQGQAFPEFMQKIIKAEGLMNYINQKEEI